MKDIQKVLAWICAALFVITGVLALLLFNIEQQAFAPETYKQAFEKQKLYERMPAILANVLYSSVAKEGNADSYLKVLTVTDWQAGISDLLSPEELRSLSDSAIDSVFDYLNNKSDSASISLLPLKNRLVGPQGLDVVRRILNAQPDCTSEQLIQMGFGFISGDIALCNPPEEMMGLVTPLIESQLQAMIVVIPDEITLISNTNNIIANDLRVKLNSARLLMKLMPVVPIVFLIGLLFLAIRSLTDCLKWWGGSFLVTGISSTLIALVGSPILGWSIQTVIHKQGTGFIPPMLTSTLRETVSAVSQQILNPVMFEGLILGIIGAGMVIAAYFAKKPVAQVRSTNSR